MIDNIIISDYMQFTTERLVQLKAELDAARADIKQLIELVKECNDR